jgi:hypothetical protein
MPVVFGYKDHNIGIVRAADEYDRNSVQGGALHQVVADCRPCRFCNTPVTKTTLGCAVVAVPGRGAVVNSVNMAVCLSCDSDSEDFTKIETLANDLDTSPQLRSQVYPIHSSPKPQ